MPDLIWFDNTRAYGTPSYHVQALFAQNRPDVVVPVTVEGARMTLPPLPAKDVATYGANALPPYHPESLPPLFVSAGRDERARELIVTVVNPYAETREAEVVVRGAPSLASAGRAIVLTSASADDENLFESPRQVVPTETPLAISGSTLRRAFPANSLTILRLKAHE